MFLIVESPTPFLQHPSEVEDTASFWTSSENHVHKGDAVVSVVIVVAVVFLLYQVPSAFFLSCFCCIVVQKHPQVPNIPYYNKLSHVYIYTAGMTG